MGDILPNSDRTGSRI